MFAQNTTSLTARRKSAMDNILMKATQDVAQLVTDGLIGLRLPIRASLRRDCKVRQGCGNLSNHNPSKGIRHDHLLRSQMGN